MFCLLPIAFTGIHSIYNNFPRNDMLIRDNNFAMGMEEKKNCPQQKNNISNNYYPCATKVRWLP